MSTVYEVKLPSEIISVIISYIPRDRHRAYTLWSCCLLAHEWYGSAVGPLYESPLLNNRNFDKFARTICPPVNSHIRRIGLESLVHRLDMGNLAYESTNSLTARMLRRTRLKLEVFVAPAVSFSISCLAPLSKCTNLKALDLSRDFYDLELPRLLKAIRKLPIEDLCLPRSAMRRGCHLESWSLTIAQWPTSLRHLVITEWLPSRDLYWRQLFSSLPDSLTSIAFEEIFNWSYFWQLCHNDTIAERIRHLRISLRQQEEDFPISALLKIFPNLVSIGLPTPRLTSDARPLPGMVLQAIHESVLEEVKFRKIPGLMRTSHFVPLEFIVDLVKNHTKLAKVTIPEDYLQIVDEEAANAVEEIEILLARRVDDAAESGLFLS